jgi:PAS domain S-box-containing protein
VSTTGRPDPIGIRDRSSAAPDFLRAAFERLPIGVLMADMSGAIVLVNRELERIFGYSSAELIGQSVDVLVSDSSPARPADLRAAFLHPPQAQVIGLDRELFGRHKNGSEVLVEIGLTPIPFEGSQLVVASVSDVTERRRVEVELRTTHDERLRFETLVSELGAEFINLRHDDVDRGIEDALGRVVRTLDLDRGAIFQLVEDSGDFVHTHQWTRPGWAAPQPRVSAQEQFPWHLAQVSRRRARGLHHGRRGARRNRP